MAKIGTIGFERLDLDIFPENHYFRKLQPWLDKNALVGNFFDYVIVNGIPVHFQEKYKRIGINFSGGADSSMLTYILAKMIDYLGVDSKIYPLAISRFHDIENFSDGVKDKIYDFLKEQFPNIIQPIVWGFIPTPFEYNPIKSIKIREPQIKKEFKYLVESGANLDVLYFNFYNDWVSRKYNLDVIYNGTTTNPVTSEYIPGLPEFRDAVDQLFKHIPTIVRSENFKNSLIVVPFDRLEKSWVTAQYDNFELQDLFNLTQSCVTIFKGCGDFSNCFHCAERDWSVRNKFYYLKENAYEF